MPDVAAVLRQEITRLARKEVRQQLAPVKKAQTEFRQKIFELRREVTALQKSIARLEKAEAGRVEAVTKTTLETTVRFAPRWVAADRKRLGLSADDYGKLIGVSGQTIYSWESGKARPRAERLAAWGAVRRLGIREARRRLEELKNAE